MTESKIPMPDDDNDMKPAQGDSAGNGALAQLGAELRFARKQAGLTQADVGAKAGFSRQLVNRIEKGYNCEIVAFIAIAGAVGRRLSIAEDASQLGEQSSLALIMELPEPGANT